MSIKTEIPAPQLNCLTAKMTIWGPFRWVAWDGDSFLPRNHRNPSRLPVGGLLLWYMSDSSWRCPAEKRRWSAFCCLNVRVVQHSQYIRWFHFGARTGSRRSLGPETQIWQKHSFVGQTGADMFCFQLIAVLLVWKFCFRYPWHLNCPKRTVVFEVVLCTCERQIRPELCDFHWRTRWMTSPRTILAVPKDSL